MNIIEALLMVAGDAPSGPVYGPVGLTFIASGYASAASVAIPAGAAAGDLAVLFDTATATTTTNPPTAVYPSGWTTLAGLTSSGTGTNYGTVVSAKVLASGDIGGTVTTMGGNNQRKQILIFRPTVAITSFAVQDLEEWRGVDGVDPAAMTINASAATGTVLAFVQIRKNSGTAGFDSGGGSFDDLILNPGSSLQGVAYKIQNSSPADITHNVSTATGSNLVTSFYLDVLGVVSGGGPSAPTAWTFSVTSSYAAYTGQDAGGAGLRDGALGSSLATMWGSTSSGTNSITADFGAVKHVSTVSLGPATGRDGWNYSYLHGAALKYSTDGSTWTTERTLSFTSDTLQNLTVNFDAQYVRVEKAGYVCVGELYFA